MPQGSEGIDDVINNALLAKQVANGLSATTKLIQSLAADIRENAINVATLRAEMGSLKEDVNALSSMLLTEQQGNKPIITRLALLEQLAVDIEKNVDKLETTGSDINTKLQTLDQSINSNLELRKLELESAKESKKSRIQLIIALITSIGALVAALISAFF